MEGPDFFAKKARRLKEGVADNTLYSKTKTASPKKQFLTPQKYFPIKKKIHYCIK
jgi:hypothetical protein